MGVFQNKRYIIRNNKKPPMFFLCASRIDRIPSEVVKKIVALEYFKKSGLINLVFKGIFKLDFIKV